MENELNSELIMMNALLGRDLNDDKVDVKYQFDIDTSSLTFENLKDTLLKFNPSINRMDLMMQMNQLDINANSKELIPDIMVQGMLMRMPKGMIVTTQTPMDMLGMGETEYMYSIMASVTLPFMPWSSSKINNREEELLSSIKGIQLEKENMTRDMSATLMMQINKINSLRAKINSLQDNVIPELKNIIEVQRTEFLAGKISIRNIIDNLRMLLMKEEELAEYQAQHQSAMYELQNITGFSQFNNEKGI